MRVNINRLTDSNQNFDFNHSFPSWRSERFPYPIIRLLVTQYFKINGECLALNTNLDRVTKRHDHHELRPRLLGQALHAQYGTAATADDDAELLEDHDVPGERARLVGEEVRDEAELLVDVGRVAPGHTIMLAGHKLSSGHIMSLRHLAGTSLSASYSFRSHRKNWLAGNFCSSRVTYMEMGMR